MAQMYKVFNYDIPLFIHSELFHYGDKDNFLYLRIDEDDEWQYFIEKLWKINGVKGVSVYSEGLEKTWENFKRYFKIVQAAGGIIENEYGEILVIDRNGFLDLPKGHIEAGEIAQEAALREVEEECGLKRHRVLNANPKVSYHVYKEKNKWILKKTFWFAMHASLKEVLIPQKEEGIEAISWMSKASILDNKDRFYSSLLDLLL
jgi:8-oxo-dGTP pyrophosphatase MutT (NUDIX family)